MDTLHVGIVTYDFFPFIGGQGRVTYDLWRHLSLDERVRVSVFSPARSDLPDHTSTFAFTQRYGRHPLFSLLASATVRRWARKSAIDVLHVNGGPGGVLLLRDPGVPLVYSIYHTYEQVVRRMAGNRWKSAVLRLEQAAYRHAALVACSTASSEASVRLGLGIAGPTRVIPCGIDFDAFPARAQARDPNVILFVGRLDNRKQPGLLLQAFLEVARRRPQARLVVVGRGPLERRLKERAYGSDFAERISFQDFVHHDALVEWYNRAAIVAVPSAFEGFGLSAAEAQSCGAAVIATDTEGLRDVIDNGATGIVVAPLASSLAEALITLLDDPERRRALGTAAAATVRESYRWPKIANAFVDTYLEAWQTRSSSGR